jgi:type IV pilus assembly protein PilE
MIPYKEPDMHSRTHRRHRGFTLIEMMITVVVIAILAGIALPSYREQIARGKRSDVQTALIEDAAYMQRYYAANNTYLAVNGVTLQLPTTQSPGAPAAANYTITVDPAPNTTDTTFRLTATPVGSMVNDKCGSFTYDNLGRKDIIASGPTVASCWR